MINGLWSTSGTAYDADAGEISGDFSPINHRPLAITHCQLKSVSEQPLFECRSGIFLNHHPDAMTHGQAPEK